MRHHEKSPKCIGICQYQKLETHPFLRAEFSIIEGEEEFIPYPSRQKPPRQKRDMER